MTGPILIAGEDAGRRKKLASVLLSAGYRIIEAESGYRTLDLLRRRPNIALALIELEMSDISGVNFIANIRAAGIKTALIALVSNESDERLRQAVDAGVNDFLVFPVSPLRLVVAVVNLLQRSVFERRMQLLQARKADHAYFKDFTAKSEAMERMMAEAQVAALGRKPLLVTGEPGTRPEILARFIHRKGRFSEGPFVHVLCSRSLDKAFSAAEWLQELGRKLDEARGGTLFLSDVDMLDTALQSQLLQLLEQRSEEDYHLVASASAHLPELVAEGSFSGKLFRKLAVGQIEIPPLRNRREDIANIANLVLVRILAETGHVRITGISGAAEALLLQYDWPGNMTELENVLYRAVLLSDGPLLTVHDFPQLVQRKEDGADAGHDGLVREGAEEGASAQVFYDADGHILPLASIEKRAISEAMKRYRGKISEVARRLQIGRSTLYRKLEEYGLGAKSD